MPDSNPWPAASPFLYTLLHIAQFTRKLGLAQQNVIWSGHVFLLSFFLPGVRVRAEGSLVHAVQMEKGLRQIRVMNATLLRHFGAMLRQPTMERQSWLNVDDSFVL